MLGSVGTLQEQVQQVLPELSLTELDLLYDALPERREVVADLVAAVAMARKDRDFGEVVAETDDWKLLQVPGADFAKHVDRQKRAVIALIEIGAFEQAEPLARDTVRDARMLFSISPDPGAVDLASALNFHACTLGALGRSADAEALFKEAIDLLERNADTHQQERSRMYLASALHNYGKLKEETGALKEALALTVRAVEARPLSQPPTTHELFNYINSISNLTVVAEKCGSLHIVDEYFEAAEQANLAMRAINPLENDPPFVAFCVQIAKARWENGDFLGSLRCAERGLPIAAVLFAKHPERNFKDFFGLRFFAGSSMEKLGRIAEALKFVDEALDAALGNRRIRGLHDGYIASTLLSILGNVFERDPSLGTLEVYMHRKGLKFS